MTALRTRRPRPGPLPPLVLIAAGGAALSGGFVVLVAIGSTRVAAVLLAAVPLAALVLRVPRLGRYVERHAGADATGHTLVAAWAAGFVALAAGADVTAARLGALVAAVAAGAAAVARIVWARHPRELRSRGVPGVPSDRREIGPWSGSAVAVAAATASILIALDTGRLTAVAGVVAGLEALAASATAVVAARRVLAGDGPLRAALGRAIRDLAPDTIVHFSGSIDSRYQLGQWMPLLEGRRVLLVLREDPVFHAADWAVPTVMVREFPDLDLVVAPSTRVALYANTSTKNNHLIRFGHLTHVQLHHGDSDKPFGASKPMRLYDHHVVAGPAARDRLVAAGLVGSDEVSMVGRPQAAALRRGSLGHDRPVVVYAPTWEGFHLDTPYSSVAVLGEELVRSVPSGMVLVVRPHPLTGSVDRRLRASLARIERAVAARGEDGRFVHPGAEPLAATLDEADVLIGDVSSVLVDFVAADRPALVTDVGGIGEQAMRSRFPSTAWAGVLEPNLGNLGDLLADALGADVRADGRREARAWLLGDVADPVARFGDALDRLVAQASSPTDR